MSKIWERLTTPRAQEEELKPADRTGGELYAEFHDCLDVHRNTVFLGMLALWLVACGHSHA